ncbi:MAG: hypothetical protein P8L66_06170 [Rhodospirillaceae bacterium]|nr:hypothetical protein [Rhodospirillaceae bacterium]
MTDNSDGAIWRQGRIWISVVSIVTGLAGWLAYDAMVSPKWMRDFGLEMTARATIISDRSAETAFSTMRGRPEPDSPFICLANLTPFEWDRVFFVASGGPVPSPLAKLNWVGESVVELNTRLESDPRYQLIAFERAGEVVELGYYFTMWANLSALGRADGFSRESAVFIADSDGETFAVRPEVSFGPDACTKNKM